jgi:hypothetical protein
LLGETSRGGVGFVFLRDDENDLDDPARAGWQNKHEQGRIAGARDLPVPIHGRFNECSDTANSKEAKVLLEELK